MTASPLQQTFGFGATKEKPAAPPRRRNLVIEAGAGTGKTTAIVAEVLRLMLEDEHLSPERIVLVTFTEKAAGEIADRIHAALAELELHFDDERIVWPVGSPKPLFEVLEEKRAAFRRACAQQLASIHLLHSQTIHSFCQSLLRQFPIEAELDPQFKIIEGFERSLLYSELYDAWIDEETRTHTDPGILREWEVLLAHAGYLFQVRDMIFSLVDRRDLLGEHGLSFGEIAELENELRLAVSAIRSANLDTIADEASRRTFSYMQRASLPERGSVDGWLEFFAPIAGALRELDLPKGKNNSAVREALRYLRTSDKKGKSIYDRLASHRAAMALHALAGRFIAFLDREKRKLGVVDFDDLLLRTLALLDDTAALERVRRQYDFIFVDEFQDTDRTQAKIIDRLARDAAGAYVAGKTVVVGDPKQSIYGFRRADPETYFKMTERLVGEGAERRRIDEQYRSDAPLLAAINAMFARVFPDVPAHDPNVFRPSYGELRAAKQGCDRELDARLTFLHAECGESSDRFLAEAEAIAQWIEASRDEDGSDLRRFVLLFRRLTIVDDYLDTFDRHGIEFVLPPSRMFLDRPAPVAMMAVLRAIAYPFDRGAQISAARTPYFALTDEEFVRGALGELPLEPGDEGSAWLAFTQTIARYRDASRQLTISQLMDLIVETTDIERVYGALADRRRSQRHLDHLRALAFDYDQRIGGSVRQFVDEIARRRNDPDEMEPLLADDSRNAVRILSVHAAKGLEFDTVILPDLAFSATGNDGARIFAVEEPESLVLCSPDSISAQFRFTNDGEKLKRVSTRREEAEARRLFYVAVTRARTDVVFVHTTPAKVNKGSFYACLRDDAGVAIDTFPWSAGRQILPINLGGVSIPIAIETAPPTDAAERRRRRLTDERLEDELASSAIVPLNIRDPQPLQTMSGAEVAVARSRRRNRDAGILLHRFLEIWDGRTEAAPLLDALAAEVAAPAGVVARVRQRVATVARSPVMQRIAAAETIGAEVPVRTIDQEGAVVEKRIDRLIREETGEVVIDYKSGKADKARLARDREQVARYCAAIAAITGRPCKGILWYIDDENDVAVDV
jgi:ATP-dependent helicase/nuclease subunit A